MGEEKNKKHSMYNYLKDDSMDEENGLLLAHKFNIEILELYKNLNFYFDENIVNEIYPEIYNSLLDVLNSSIDRKVPILFFQLNLSNEIERVMERVLKEKNIDLFSEGCLLSKVEFSDLEKEILRNGLDIIFTHKKYDISIRNRKKSICKKLNISGARYNLELMKIMKEIYIIKHEEAKIKSLKI